MCWRRGRWLLEPDILMCSREIFIQPYMRRIMVLRLSLLTFFLTVSKLKRGLCMKLLRCCIWYPGVMSLGWSALPYYNKRLNYFTSQCAQDLRLSMSSGGVDNDRYSRMQAADVSTHASDPYRDLELHISGRMVATATRVPPKSYCDGVHNEDTDHIHVYLISDDNPVNTSEGFTEASCSGNVGSRILLGTITGIQTSSEEGSCLVYNSSGTKTHVIMKHRTLLVKHMHWYGLGDNVSVCECRCTRARLPPSKFWLFEPRCGMHDIGGWYVETFGKDKKGRLSPSHRYWDGFDAEQSEKRLHPVMYLLAMAYRTLDLEDAKRKKLTFRDVVDRNLFKMLSWCKRLV